MTQESKSRFYFNKSFSGFILTKPKARAVIIAYHFYQLLDKAFFLRFSTKKLGRGKICFTAECK